MSMGRLTDKVIVVSGGTKGVGCAFAKAAGAQGAKVVLGGRDEKAGHRIAESICSSGSDAVFVRTDIKRIADCRNLFDEAYKRFKHIDGFFNYAGVTPVSPLDTCDEATFDEVMTVNFKAAFFCCQQAVKYMRMSGGGSIVLTGSAHAWGGEKDRAAYACSKGVLITLSEHIAKNYASEKIRCNYLTLGWTATEGELALRSALGESEEELRRRAAAHLPMGKMPEPMDYIAALIYLMSDESKIMTGSIFRMTAGEYI
ncbi:MAG: SDR family oxidoreductase [Selenomonadaceae bacterium]|nr:SDR family oxidoreductase [Selenomonadaceae bacterium]